MLSAVRYLPLLSRYFHRRSVTHSFRDAFGHFPNVRSPLTFNEKLCRRKLNSDDPTFALLADKVLVKDYVRERVGEQYLIPTLYSGPSLPRERDWPLPFVIKANHGSGFNIFVRSKPDWESIENKVSQFLSLDYGKMTAEIFYSHIRRQILVEPFISADGQLPVDYKFFVFNGAPKLVQIDTSRERNHKRAFFDLDWKKQNFTFLYPIETDHIPKPKSFDRMLYIASRLGDGLDFVRIDLYEIGDQPYFGEISFIPESGFGKFDPPEIDLQIGSLWH